MKKLILISTTIFLSTLCLGQKAGANEWHANWMFGLPVGNSFVTSFSALGFNLGYSKFVKDDLSVGIEMSWNNYYQYAPRQTYHFSDGSAATTDLYKYIYTLPITLYASHYFRSGDLFTPFVKLGLGAQYSEQNIYYNVYETTNDNWGFVAIPEVGTLVHLSKGSPWSVYTSVRYRYSTNSAKDLGVNSVQSVDFNVGFSCIFH
ncbi:MAG TPA: outer membrane beta-barrel protein [Puia sp.]|nr:outer membrane beta-barrel protein [Puia sp.]